MIKSMPLKQCKIRSIVQPLAEGHELAGQLLRIEHHTDDGHINVSVVYGYDKNFTYDLDPMDKVRVIATE